MDDPSDGYVAPPRTTPNPFLKVDENVLAKLPNGATVVSITPYGSSFWTQTARLETQLPYGTKRSYFLKVALEEKGREMLNGEFESMTALYATSPEFVPKPHAWGSYQSLPDTHFFLCDFHDMIEELPPDIDNFTKRLADLHRSSISASPGKFGFHICTYMGPLPQDNNWCDTWEEFYIQVI
ncbi:Fructosamine kinase-domain-containing protein [Tirmania nivea]|nr:Fructosamine kinase-domain-containing protein [Tirmania nivea]